VSRPRKPFGANHPGRLPATMMKVLAAEMSDPSRLRRGKQYAKDGSVLDIIVEPGVVTCEIQGSRSTPYIASVEVTPGDGMPLRRDIRTSCTCPDDENWDGYACKHVVATMFALGDEFLLEPELLDVWRNRATASAGRTTEPDDLDGDVDGDHDPDHDPDDDHDDDDDDRPVRRAHRHLHLVGKEPAPARVERPPRRDPIDELTTMPAGTHLPELPAIEMIDPDLPRSRDLAALLRDALANLRIHWD
jgi:hypothetical protein